MGLLSLLLGGGELKSKLKAELEAEGLVLVEERLKGSIRYTHFKAPGKRFHRPGKNGSLCGSRSGSASAGW